MSARIAVCKRRIRPGALIFARARVKQRCGVTEMSGDLLVGDQEVNRLFVVLRPVRHRRTYCYAG